MPSAKKRSARHKKPFHVRAVERRQRGSMDFHSGELLLIAYRARDSARKEAEGNIAALPPDAVIAAIVACAACEAFINELCVDIEASVASGWRQVSPELVACAKAIRQVENSHGSLEDKYSAASVALKAAFSKGSSPFQDFAHLVNLRNGLMHMKPVSATGPTAAVLKTISALETRKIARNWSQVGDVPWVGMIENPDAATWACDTARTIILAVLAMTPEHSPPVNDPLHGFKSLFRSHTGFIP